MHPLRNVFNVQVRAGQLQFSTLPRLLKTSHKKSKSKVRHASKGEHTRAPRGYRLLERERPRPVSALVELRESIFSSDLPGVLTRYPALVPLLQNIDTLEIARLLHHKVRSWALEGQGEIEPLKEAALQFQDLYKNGKLPAHPVASLHLVALWRDARQYDQGIEFCNWVMAQDDSYVDLRTYGVVIELLATYGQDLEYCESVYSHALKRFPRNFNEYHLSHGAILPNRSEPVQIPGTNMVLVQGITKARLVHGDWRNAYLALDTALRLYPTQVTKHTSDIFLGERPLQEAFQVHCLICQSGSQPSIAQFTRLLVSLRWARSFDDELRPTLQFVIAMLTSLHYHIAAKGELDQEHLSLLLRTCFEIVSEQPSLQQDQINELLSQILKIFNTVGISVTEHLTSFFPERDPKGRVEVVLWALDNLVPSIEGLSGNSIRMLLARVAATRDATLMKKVWALVVNNPKVKLNAPIWKIFARVSASVDNAKFIRQQMETQHIVEGSDLAGIINMEIQQNRPAEEKQSAQTLAPDTFTEEEFNQFLSAFRSFGRVIAEQNWSDLEESPPRQDTFYTCPFAVDESWQRKLWDELSLPPSNLRGNSDPKVALETPAARGVTGLTLEEVRYRNWKGINNLLLQAELFESRIQSSADAAIKDRTATSRLKGTFGIKNLKKLSELFHKQALERAQDIKIMSSWTWTEDEWRQKILTLRGVEVIKSPEQPKQEPTDTPHPSIESGKKRTMQRTWKHLVLST
ncbi:MAG: hypothetical protein MMC33_003942 [Icmadophila ericetorum]|nr:hypothetical protein [Icmadophila ericetorum]